MFIRQYFYIRFALLSDGQVTHNPIGMRARFGKRIASEAREKRRGQQRFRKPGAILWKCQRMINA
jgi:hypothetical protein